MGAVPAPCFGGGADQPADAATDAARTAIPRSFSVVDRGGCIDQAFVWTLLHGLSWYGGRYRAGTFVRLSRLKMPFSP